MTIHRLQISSATALDLDVTLTAPVCLLCGRYADLVLDLAREVIGDNGAVNDPDRIDDGHFILHLDAELDGKDYQVCYIRNADFMGDNRIAANFKNNSLTYSLRDTKQYLNKCAQRNTDADNVFDKSKPAHRVDLSVCDGYLAAFEDFLRRQEPTDDRPLFVYDFFEHLDGSADPEIYLQRLATLGRQVFVCVCTKDPIQLLTQVGVQTINL
ncbi:MAG: hypothetical protein J6R04_02075 [Clostridia bacterium]|nr:hypothetical protein [Clostridia bacterium]